MHLTVFLFAALTSIGHGRRIMNGRSQGKSESDEEKKVDGASNLLKQFLLAFQPVPGMRSSTLHRPVLGPHASTLHTLQMQFEDYDFGMYGSRLPSDKQLEYAQSLAQQLGKALPEDASQDADRCSQFIDECVNQVPPSAKQIAFAQQISRQLGIDLPASATSNRQACSDYITANKGRLPPRIAGTGMGMDSRMGMSYKSGGYNMPSQAQILHAAQLAQSLNIGLSAEVLTDERAMSKFIGEFAADRAAAGSSAGRELAATTPANKEVGPSFQKAEPAVQKDKIELPYSISTETKVAKYDPQVEPMPF